VTATIPTCFVRAVIGLDPAKDSSGLDRRSVVTVRTAGLWNLNNSAYFAGLPTATDVGAIM
jgi:hypothetical protein